MTKDVTVFNVGTVHNTCEIKGKPILNSKKQVTINYPARLEAMALDPSKIATNSDLIYTAGQIDVCVALYKTVAVSVDPSKGDSTVLTPRTPRKPLVRHAAEIMRSALSIKGELTIDILDKVQLRHCGLGSSSGTIASVASAINELYGHPIAPHDLCVYCAQNHGEEIDDDDSKLAAVQCIGGSAVCGNYEGGLIILTGKATPIHRHTLPDDISIVIGVPNDFEHPDSLDLMTKEEINMDGFIATGKKYAETIAYRLIHKVLPDLELSRLEACKSLVYDYRWEMDSIKNCSFVLPRIVDIAESLKIFKYDPEVSLISLSSVGPGFFALTHNPSKLVDAFQSLNMNTLVTTPHNGTYSVEKNQ